MVERIIETWFDIPNWEGLYQVSNLCRIKSLPRYRRCGLDSGYVTKEKIMAHVDDKQGYKIIRFSKDGIPKAMKVHRIIAETFIPNPFNKKEVNHINGIKFDNIVENLEWATSSENRLHAFDIGLQPKGNLHPCTKLSEQVVREIRMKYHKDNYGYKKIAKEYNVTPSNIQRIINRKTWNHI